MTYCTAVSTAHHTILMYYAKRVKFCIFVFVIVMIFKASISRGTNVKQKETSENSTAGQSTSHAGSSPLSQRPQTAVTEATVRIRTVGKYHLTIVYILLKYAESFRYFTCSSFHQNPSGTSPFVVEVRTCYEEYSFRVNKINQNNKKII
ncbi:hypothetical protein PPYR_11943 [Photinus pyralis]|uniref:Uncharacterized protein n=1 Tax=Photinus pyralis TaxID=7054 RepID=A0A5N4ACR3_PHOPY|nr:hypothetical protein PPYR_11943 [Photinus pyralis]